MARGSGKGDEYRWGKDKNARQEKKHESAHILSEQTLGSPCPNCGVELDGLTRVQLGEPFEKPVELKGHVTMCVYCTAMLIFTDNQGGLRQATPEEAKEIELGLDPTLAAIYGEWRRQGTQ